MGGKNPDRAIQDKSQQQHYLPERNAFFNALAGAGKTHKLISLCREALKTGQASFVYLCYNRKLRIEARRHHRLSKRNAHTFHSLAYQDIEYWLSHKPNLELKILRQHGNHRREALKWHLSKNQSELIPLWLEYWQHSRYQNLKHVFIDELQDLSPELLQMLERLVELNQRNDVVVVAAGDSYQDLYGYRNKGFNGIERFISRFNPDISALTKSWRSTPGILDFVNGFYLTAYNGERLFSIESSSPDNDNVEIHCCKVSKELELKASSIIDNHPSKSLAVLARTNEDLERFKSAQPDTRHVNVSTIHKYKGNEADVVIIVNTIYGDRNNSQDEKNVWNVGITRAKEKLYILTTQAHAILPLFKPGTYKLVGNNTYTPLSLPDVTAAANKALLPQDSLKSTIDSITLRLPSAALPFRPRGRKHVPTYNQFANGDFHECCGIRFAWRYQKPYVTFEFTELTPFKKAGFSDYQILITILDIIKDYFREQITDAVLREAVVTDLHLARLICTDDRSALLDSLTHLQLLTNGGKRRSLKKIGKTGAQTVYLNSRTTRRKNGSPRYKRRTAIYFPDTKTINALHDPLREYIKLEKRRTRDTTKRFSMDFTIGQLLEKADLNKIGCLLQEWSRSEYSAQVFTPYKNIAERLNKKGWDSVSVIKMQIRTRKRLTTTDRRLLYQGLLHLLPEVQRNALRSLIEGQIG